MKDLVRTLKRVLENVAGHDYRLIRSRGVADLLLDCQGSELEPEEIAARMIADLTVGDLGEADQKVCLAAVDFLDHVGGSPDRISRVQKLKDLKTLLLEKADEAQFLQWARSWYP